MTELRASAIDRVLAIEDPPELLIELAELPWPVGAPLALPDVLWSLAQLYRDVVSGGMRGYLSSPDGADFTKALEGCRLVEAWSAVGYLEAARATFPNGDIPADDARRAAVADEIWLATPLTELCDALTKLDKRYGDASMYEMAESARQYALGHRDELVRIARLPDQGTSETQPPLDAMDASTQLNAILAQGRDVVAERTIAFAAQLLSLGGLPALPEGEDERLRSFCDALMTFSPDRWILVAQRLAEYPREVRLAGRLLRSLPYHGLYPAGEFDKRVEKPAVLTLAPLMAKLKMLPESVDVNGSVFPLRRLALMAAAEGWFAVSRLSWLGGGPPELDAARVLLSPFRDFVQLPEM